MRIENSQHSLWKANAKKCSSDENSYFIKIISVANEDKHIESIDRVKFMYTIHFATEHWLPIVEFLIKIFQSNAFFIINATD